MPLRAIVSWKCVASVIASLMLAACTELPPPPSPAPDGYEGVQTWYIRHDARADAQSTEDRAILQNPVNLALLRSPLGNPTHVIVAEASAWRLRRYPIVFGDPVTLGAPETIALIDPDAEAGQHIPARLDPRLDSSRFGQQLAVLSDQTVIISGPVGDLWALQPGHDAAEIGAGPGGVAPAEGVPVGGADLTEVLGVTVAPATDAHPEALIVATPAAIFAADRVSADGEPLRWGALRRVVGDGVFGVTEAGVAARAASIGLSDHVHLVSDGADVLFTDIFAGRVWWVPGWRDADAPLVAAAGGGTSLQATGEPLEVRLELLPGNNVQLGEREDGSRALLFNNNGVPTWLTFARDPSDPARAVGELTFAVARRDRQAAGLAASGGAVFVTERDFGRLIAHDTAEDTTGRLVAGRAGFDDPTLEPSRNVLPRFARPSSVVSYPTAYGDVLALTDAQTGWLLLEGSDRAPQGILASGRIGTPTANPLDLTTDFEPWHTTAVLPESPSDGRARYFVGSRLDVSLIDFEPQLCPGATDGSLCTTTQPLLTPGDTPSGVAGRALIGYAPALPPLLLGSDLDGGLVLFDQDTHAIATQLTGEMPVIDLTALRLEGGGGDNTARAMPPTDGSVSLNAARLDTLTRFALHTRGTLTAIHDAADTGAVAMGIALRRSVGDAAFADVAFRINTIAPIAGGGATPLADVPYGDATTRALDLAIPQGALSGAALRMIDPDNARGDALLIVAYDGLQRIARATPDGVFVWLTDPAARTPVNASTPDQLPLAELALTDQPSRLVQLDCAPAHTTALLTQRGVWLLNTDTTPARAFDAIDLPPQTATRVTQAPARAALCHEGQPVFLESDGASSALRFGLDGAPIALPVPSQTFAFSADSVLIVDATDAEAHARLLTAPLPSASPTGPLDFAPLSGAQPSLWQARPLRQTRLADDYPLLATHPSGDLYGLIDGLLFRIPSDPTNGITNNTRLDALWEGPPLDAPPQALAIDPASPAEQPTAYLALGDALYRIQLGADSGPVRIAGGGDGDPRTSRPIDARLSGLHGVAVGPDGRIWLRWGDRLAYVTPDLGALTLIAGGGAQSPRDAVAPWDMALPASSVAHPALAVSPNGDVYVADPLRGLVLTFTPR